jgi:hypothetical protein
MAALLSGCKSLPRRAAIVLLKSFDVAHTFSHTSVVSYIELIGLLKPAPVFTYYLQPSHQKFVPLPTLPVRVHNFLKDCFDLQGETAKLAWEAFRLLAWPFQLTTIGSSD